MTAKVSAPVIDTATVRRCDNANATAAWVGPLCDEVDRLRAVVAAAREVGIADQNASAMAARLGARDRLARAIAELDARP